MSNKAPAQQMHITDQCVSTIWLRHVHTFNTHCHTLTPPDNIPAHHSHSEQCTISSQRHPSPACKLTRMHHGSWQCTPSFVTSLCLLASHAAVINNWQTAPSAANATPPPSHCKLTRMHRGSWCTLALPPGPLHMCCAVSAHAWQHHHLHWGAAPHPSCSSSSSTRHVSAELGKLRVPRDAL
jgi:hypothetical protein